MIRIGALASGRGSNLQALVDAVDSGYIPESEIALVISDKKEAYALERAKKHNIEGLFIDPKRYKTRGEYDERIKKELIGRNVDLVLLAGYMRVLSSTIVSAFKDRVMNIHPALLPSFPGLYAQKQALDWGVKVSGCTVHYVDEDVDHGPIIIQAAVPILEEDTEESLSKRIIAQEHIIYPQAVKWHVEGKLKIEGRKVKVKGSKQAGIGLQVL